MTKLCPRCKLEMNEDSALNALSYDGETEICTLCGQIESLEKIGGVGAAEGLIVGQRRTQAAIYGLDEKGQPKLPKDKKKD